MPIFGQVWLWSSLAFLLGALLCWLLVARPARNRVGELEDQLATRARRPSVPERPEPIHPAEDSLVPGLRGRDESDYRTRSYGLGDTPPPLPPERERLAPYDQAPPPFAGGLSAPPEPVDTELVNQPPAAATQYLDVSAGSLSAPPEVPTMSPPPSDRGWFDDELEGDAANQAPEEQPAVPRNRHHLVDPPPGEPFDNRLVDDVDEDTSISRALDEDESPRSAIEDDSGGTVFTQRTHPIPAELIRQIDEAGKDERTREPDNLVDDLAEDDADRRDRTVEAEAVTPAGTFTEPSQGFAESSQGFAEPSQGFAESQGLAEPAQGFTEPSQGFAESSQGFTEPSQGFAEPAAGSRGQAPSFAEQAQSFNESAQSFAEPEQSGRGFAEPARSGEPESSGRGFAEPARSGEPGSSGRGFAEPAHPGAPGSSGRGFAESAQSGQAFADSDSSGRGFAESARSGGVFGESESSGRGFAESAQSGQAFAGSDSSGPGFAESTSGQAFAEPAQSGGVFGEAEPSGRGYAEPAQSDRVFTEPEPADRAFTEPAQSDRAFTEPEPAGRGFSEPEPAAASFTEPERQQPEPVAPPEQPQEQTEIVSAVAPEEKPSAATRTASDLPKRVPQQNRMPSAVPVRVDPTPSASAPLPKRVPGKPRHQVPFGVLPGSTPEPELAPAAVDQAAEPARSLFEPIIPAADEGMATPPPPHRLRQGSGGGRGPFGPGSAMPLPGGASPSPEFTIKASVAALRYCTPESPQFGRTVAEVWFRTAADAERVGFRPVG